LLIISLESLDEYIGDWYDGKYCRQVIAAFDSETIYLSIATDGLSLFKTRSTGLWPLFCNILNLQQESRRELQYFLPLSVVELQKGKWSDLLQLLFFTEMDYLKSKSMFNKISTY